MLQNLPYLWKKKTHVDIDQGIYKVEFKVALNEKRKKLHGFSFSINMANSEAFWGVKKLSAKLSFLKCDKPQRTLWQSYLEYKVVVCLYKYAERKYREGLLFFSKVHSWWLKRA